MSKCLHSFDGKTLDTRGRCSVCRHENYLKTRDVHLERSRNIKHTDPEAYEKQLERNRINWRELKNTSKYRQKTTNYHLKKDFGINLTQYNSLLLSQKNHCAICPKEPSKKRRLAVDHDHITGRIRGLLCTRCNVALGLLRDNPSFLANMGEYLHG